MKYKAGDRVKIKSLDWYNENKDDCGVVLIEDGDYMFCQSDTEWCGKIVTIKEVCLNEYYRIEEDFNKYRWTDGMIEGLAEEEAGLVDNLSSRWINEFNLPDGCIFKDENGNIINATKIVLEKKKEYPKTYAKCRYILGITTPMIRPDYNGALIVALQKLLICRDAYWKIAGEEMGLGKPWKPDWTNLECDKFCIWVDVGDITLRDVFRCQHILAFPTEEMRDAFYENFKVDIEICKELL